MKKKILLVACAAVAVLSSCQKETLLDQKEMLMVNFGYQGVGLSSETKAGGLLETTALPLDWDFAVTAYDYIGSEGRSDIVINQDIVSYSSSSWSAAGAPYYWPIGNVDKSGNAINTNLKMVAYAPATSLPGSFTYSSAPVISKTGVTGTLLVSNNPASQVDFLYSVPQDFTKGNTVGLTFKHGLTNVIFKAKAAANYGEGASHKDIQIVSIKLKNVYSTGSFVTTSSIVWTPSVPTEYMINNTTHNSDAFTDADAATYSGGLTLTTSYQQFGDKHLFIPQSLAAITGSTPRASVKADITVIVNKVAYYYKDIELTSFVDAISAWQEGKRVTYNMTVGLEEIVFDAPVVTDWSDQSTSKDL